MKNYLIMIFVLLLISCSNSTNIVEDEELSNEFLKVTNDIPPFEFESIKNIILTYGDVQTYRTFDGNNPHYAVDSFHCYLNSEIGQKNMWNDPEVSDFNEITIQDIPRQYSDYVYFTLQIVRYGDEYN